MSIKSSQVTALVDFFSELRSETDRAAVILGASKLDILLYQILQKYMLPCSTSNDELFEGEGPLSPLSAKINLVYRLGIIDASCSRALHLIRRIRNDFAHEASGGSLNSGAHLDRLKVLFSPFVSMDSYKKLRDGLLAGGKILPSTEFRVVLAMLVVFLEIIFNSIEPLVPTTFPLGMLVRNLDCKEGEESKGQT